MLNLFRKLAVYSFRLTLIAIFGGYSINASAFVNGVSNGSFEAPQLSDATFQYNPVGASWNFTGAGVTRANSDFWNPSLPEIPAGKQVAFIQTTGSISQSIYVPPGSILTFSATQRINNGNKQRIRLLANGQPLPIKFGSDVNGVGLTSEYFTPPEGYFTTYAASLSNWGGGNIVLSFVGTSTQDATAFIDSVILTTPSQIGYGFSDPLFAQAAWRSDLPQNTTSFYTGDCLSNNAALYGMKILTAGPTPSGGTASSTSIECYGAASGPYPMAKKSNWYASANYLDGNPYWAVGVNTETPTNGCSNNYGPANQSRPLAIGPAFGQAGYNLSFNQLTTSTDPAIGNYNLASLGFNHDPNDCGGNLPYMSLSSNANQGNQAPIALATASRSYNPYLNFRSAVMTVNPASITFLQIVLKTSGWSDGIDRMVTIQTMNSPSSYVGGFLATIDHNLSNPGNFFNSSQFPMKNYLWNWNIKKSRYYPGAVYAQYTSYNLNQICGTDPYYVPLPVISNPAANTYKSIVNGNFGPNNPNAIQNVRMNLYSTIACLARDGAWAQEGKIATLPDPLIVSHVEWSLEQVDNNDSNIWYGLWAPTITNY